MREGMYDVIAQDDVRDLTADDLQLLLSGTAAPLGLDDFAAVTQFKDVREEAVRCSDTAGLAAFEEVFWDALRKLSEMELLKLSESWTATATSLPASLTVNLCDNERDV